MKRGPGERAGLTHASVLTAARELVAGRGAGALTMRAVAARLDVAPNALYSHVANKTQLIDDLLDDLLADVDAPDPDAPDPVAAVAAMLTSTYGVLTAHADLVPLYLARQGARGPNAVRLGEILDALLGRAGVQTSLIVQARRILIIHTIGSAAFAVEAPLAAPTTNRQTLAEDFTKSLHWLVAGITS
jgi:TetR/AcrR family tetracycline transcriptional repressor